MNIWVTGMAGFLGRHVAAEVVRMGHVLVRREINLLEVPTSFNRLLPPLDAVIHCAAVCRWSRAPHADERFLDNVTMAKNLAEICWENDLGQLASDHNLKVVVPLPHGALNPWNASSSAAQECARIWESKEAQLVYLPTLYGEGDPHHAKALPSFMLCGSGRGESRMVLYGGGVARRQYMHVEQAAKVLAVFACTTDHERVLARGEEWSMEGLAAAVMAAARAAGRVLEPPEHRPWQYRPDGLGSPSPDRVGPEIVDAPRESNLERWIDETVRTRLDALRLEKEQAVVRERLWFEGACGVEGCERRGTPHFHNSAASAGVGRPPMAPGPGHSGSSEDPSSW